MNKKKCRQALAFIPLFMNCALAGMNLGWLAPVLKKSQEPGYDISLTLDQCTWLVALQEPAKIIGVIFCILTLDVIGRKKIVFAASLFNLLAWILIRLSKSTVILFISRIILGAVSGFLDSTHTIYVGENSSPDMRGTFITILISFIFVGLVAGSAIATYLSYDTVTLVNIAASFIALLSSFLARETTQFLLMKGRDREAEKTYNWLFPEDSCELKKIKESIRSNTEYLKLTEFFSNPTYYKGTAIAVLSVVMVTATGVWSLAPFASMIFGETDTLNPNEFTICFSFVQMIAALAPAIFIERFNRRTIFMASLAISGLAHAGSAVLYFVHDNVTPIKNFPWLIFTTVCIYSLVSLMGMLPISDALRAELFAQKVKPLGNALSVLGCCTTAFIIAATFLRIARVFGYFADFLLLSLNSWIALLFVFFCVPETRGKSLIEIQMLLQEAKTTKDIREDRIRNSSLEANQKLMQESDQKTTNSHSTPFAEV